MTLTFSLLKSLQVLLTLPLALALGKFKPIYSFGFPDRTCIFQKFTEMEVYSTVVKGTQNDNFAPMENKAGESSIPNTAIECFSKILLEERFCDVIFHVGPSEEKIKAHRSFLMARSEVFEAQFRGDWENSDRILLPQFEPTAFRSFLKVISINFLQTWSSELLR